MERLTGIKVGDKAIFNGKDPWLGDDFNNRWRGDTCTILGIRESPFEDAKVAFDSFPKVNWRDIHNQYLVPADTLQPI